MTIPLMPGSRGEHDLQERYGNQKRAEGFYKNQMLSYLNPPMRTFIARQEMFFVSTADGHGACDVSFRAGEVGFVHVLTEQILVFPEYHGNGVTASLGNIAENPHAGLPRRLHPEYGRAARQRRGPDPLERGAVGLPRCLRRPASRYP